MSEFLVSENQLSDFEEKGYCIIKDFWSDEILKKWENAIIVFHYQQALKIVEGQEKFANKNPLDYKNYEDLEKVLEFLEVENKDAAYQTYEMLANCTAAKYFMTHQPFSQVCSKLIDCPEELLIPLGPVPLINRPSTKRLLYHWHTELHYYPKRRNFLNVWFPTFTDKNESNGTMYFCEGSHQQNWDFVEYRGYDKNSYGKPNHFTQYEIPEEETKKFKKIPLILKRGDMVLFDRNLLHTSSVNKSERVSIASVMRIYDFRGDFTLSGNPEVKPYKDDSSGIPNLIPLKY